MRLAALADRGSWGQFLVNEARRRGWETQLFRRAEEVREADYAFMRIDQKPPRNGFEKIQAEALAARGVRLIPDLGQIRLYDDKLAQSMFGAMQRFMPATLVITNERDLDMAASALGFPMLSKTSQGSASHDVRMIRDTDALRREAKAALGNGLKARYVVQRGYLILQQFLPGNGYDYRVCRIGRRAMMLRRENRSEAQPFASGSGKCTPIRELTAETTAVLAAAEAFFDALRTHWCGIDLVKDARGRWLVLEVTLGWTQAAYAECSFFGTPYSGADIWRLTCDEIEAGAFA